MANDGIFISYRRADSAAMAGRIRDRILDRLPGRPVFLDVDSIAPGSDFEEVIQSTLAKSAVMLVLIGDRWMLQQDGKAEARIHDPDDYVRREIDWALQAGLLIIPVRIDNAGMPSPNQLPAEIRAFAKKNAAELRHSRFDDDCERLLDAIDPQRPRPSQARPIVSAIVGSLIGLLTLIFALLIHNGLTGLPISTRLGEFGRWLGYLLVPLSLLLGGAAGWYLSRRRSRNG